MDRLGAISIHNMPIGGQSEIDKLLTEGNSIKYLQKGKMIISLSRKLLSFFVTQHAW